MTYLLQNRAERRRAHRHKSLALPWFYLSKKKKTPPTNDALGRPSTISFPDNRKDTYQYDNEGHPIELIEAGSGGGFHSTTTDYDSLGRPVTVTYTDGSHQITQYDAQGHITDVIDPAGKHIHNTYDDAGRKLSTIAGYMSANPQETDFTYDNNGNVKTVSVAGRLQATNTYDSLNRLTRVDFIDGTFTTTEYDNDGRKTATVDQGNKRTEFSWDNQSRMTEVRQISSLGNFKTDFGFDQVGNQLSQTDANSHQTTYTADVMGRRTSRHLPDGRTETYNQFDPIGNLTQKTDFAGNAFTYGYDPNNDLLTSVSGPGVSESYTYDGFLRRQSMTDPSGQTTFNYDSIDRLAGQTSPTGFGALTYTYFPNGLLNTISSSNTNGNNLTYEYDSLNRPATILDGVKTTTLSYDPVGNLASVVMPNGVTVVYGVDSLNRVTGVSIVGGSGVLGGSVYTLGPAGNRTNVQEASGRAVSFLDDDLYRLTNENILVDSTGNTGPVAYNYDFVGNRNTRSTSITGLAPQTFTGGYNTADLLKPTFNFDQLGNQLSDGQGRTYQYNALNQLTRVTGTGLDVAYVYDGDGLRVQKTNNLTGMTTNYLWARNNITGNPQVSEELQNGQVVRRYVYGPRGPLYMVQLVGSTWVTSYFGMDAQNVKFLMNDSGQVTDQYTWDAFGNLLSSSGAGTANNVGAFGEYADSDTGLIYLRARWMNPSLGRFMEMDSYEGDPNSPFSLHKYNYASGDPQDRLDPSGNDDYSDMQSAGNVGSRALAPQSIKPNISKMNLEFNAFIPSSLGSWLPEPFPGSAYEFETDERGFGGGSSRVKSTGSVDKNLIGKLSRSDLNYVTTGSGSHRRTKGTHIVDPPAGPFNTGYAVVVNPNASESVIEMEGRGPYAYHPFASPDLSYDVIWDIRLVNPNQVQMTLRGNHTAFPSCEGLFNQKDVYEYDAVAHGMTGPNLINLNTFVNFTDPPVLINIK